MMPSRRAFLQAGAAGIAALVIGCRIDPAGDGPVQKVAEPVQDAPPGPELNAWVAIRADDVVDLTIPEA
jgi:hypothetical protein